MTLLDLYKDLPDASLYSLKRAGDWGQVEHCVRYRKIFVTRDKLAALYAMYRRVPFIYMSIIMFSTHLMQFLGLLNTRLFLENELLYFGL